MPRRAGEGSISTIRAAIWSRPYPFSELRRDALAMARRLIARGIDKGDRVALVAETGPDFAALFCGAIYAGAWPVPLPLPTSFGGKEHYIDQIAVQMQSAEPGCCSIPKSSPKWPAPRPRGRAAGHDLAGLGTRAGPPADLPEPLPDDICFLQYSSGSTRFPHGVAVTHRSLLDNLAAHAHGMQIRRERPLHQLAAVVSRHGAGRLLPLADRQPVFGRLPQDRGFRPPPARLARS